jgi:hypothetical protein
MKITVSNIKKTLEKDYGWSNLHEKSNQTYMIDELIKDVLSVIDSKLKYHKNISIK